MSTVETRASRVDSRWWYWVAVTPVYFVVSVVLFGGVVFAFVAGAAAGGLPAAVGFGIAAVVLFFVLPGILLTVMFPLAIYLDALEVADAELEWRPDAVLYGLVAVVGVLATAFTVSVPLAIYYLYQRHRYVGVP